MAKRKRFKKSRSSRSWGGKRKRSTGGMRAQRQRVVLEIHHVAAGSLGSVVPTGNPASPFAAPVQPEPGRGKFR